MHKNIYPMVLIIACAMGTELAAAEQAAIDGCIDRLRADGGADGASGTVLDSEFSEAATLVTLRDAGGTIWECLAYSDGAVETLRVINAMDDNKGVVSEPEITRQSIQFAKGTSGTELMGTLTPGSSAQYTLGAQDGQFLYVHVAASDAPLDYQIFNPDGSFLLDLTASDREYRGQLWQSGKHMVEIVNRSNQLQEYTVIFGIE
ncbi:MAG: hypothetical protein ABJO67_06125 [Pseudoruegeria sp.]